jgi:hypothetical protein
MSGRETRRSPLFEGVLTFEGTMQALRAEKRVKAAAVECRLVPTPRELSSTCALALTFAQADCEAVGAALVADGWRVEAAYLYPGDGSDPVPWQP